MEHILNENGVKSKKTTLLVYVVSTAMVFGVLNPLACVMDRNTPREISSMGKAVDFQMCTLSSGKEYSKYLAENAKRIVMKKAFAGKVVRNHSVTDIEGICNQILMDTPVITHEKADVQVKQNEISERKPVVQLVDTKINHSENVTEDRVHNPVTDIPENIVKPAEDTDTVTPGVIENPIQEEVTEEPAYIELRGMKIDSEGYVTAIADGVSDGLLVFPTDVRCKGIRAEAIENLEAEVKDEITEIWIPANITYIEEGTFNNLKNVNFIEAAEENPTYYSETGILYYKDGSVACMPQRRLRS